MQPAPPTNLLSFKTYYDGIHAFLTHVWQDKEFGAKCVRACCVYGARARAGMPTTHTRRTAR